MDLVKEELRQKDIWRAELQRKDLVRAWVRSFLPTNIALAVCYDENMVCTRMWSYLSGGDIFTVWDVLENRTTVKERLLAIVNEVIAVVKVKNPVVYIVLNFDNILGTAFIQVGNLNKKKTKNLASYYL